MIALWDRIAILLVCYNLCCLSLTSLHHWCSSWVWASSHESSPLEFQGCGVSVLLSPLYVWKKKKRTVEICSGTVETQCSEWLTSWEDHWDPSEEYKYPWKFVWTDSSTQPWRVMECDGAPRKAGQRAAPGTRTAWCCLAPHTKCQGPRWAIVIMAVSPQGTFNLGGCAVNNREPKKGGDYAESLVRWKYQIKSSLAC